MTEVSFFDITKVNKDTSLYTCVANLPSLSSTKRRCHSRTGKERLHNLNKLHAECKSTGELSLLGEIAEYSICYQHKLFKEEIVSKWTEEIKKPGSGNGRNGNNILEPTLTFMQYRTENYNPEKDDIERVVNRGIIEILNNSIKESEKGSYLHIVGDETAAKGVYRVGWTSNEETGDTRFSNHSKCYPNLRRYLIIDCPNAPRFEKVVLREFATQRRQHKCANCTKTHIEWIEAPVEDIIGSVSAWARFAQRAYPNDTWIDLPELPSSSFSTEPGRWTKWALEKTELWKKSRCSTEVSDSYSAQEIASAKQSPRVSCDSIELPPSPVPVHLKHEELVQTPRISSSGKLLSSTPRLLEAISVVSQLAGLPEKSIAKDVESSATSNPGILNIVGATLKNLLY